MLSADTVFHMALAGSKFAQRLLASSNQVLGRSVLAATSIWYFQDKGCKGEIVYTRNPSRYEPNAILTGKAVGVGSRPSWP
jgi:hypothetical protein